MRGVELAKPPRRTREAYGPDMRFRVLGPLEVTGEHGPVPLGAESSARSSRTSSADALIDQVWATSRPSRGGTSFRRTSRTFGRRWVPIASTDAPPGYALRIASDELDASRFERLVREARVANGSPGRAGSLLHEALALWDGPAFDDLSYEPSLAAEIARLEELRLQALEERVGADLAEGRHSEVIGELESLTRSFPIRERQRLIPFDLIDVATASRRGSGNSEPVSSSNPRASSGSSLSGICAVRIRSPSAQDTISAPCSQPRSRHGSSDAFQEGRSRNARNLASVASSTCWSSQMWLISCRSVRRAITFTRVVQTSTSPDLANPR